jgi:hypothetical protein
MVACRVDGKPGQFEAHPPLPALPLLLLDDEEEQQGQLLIVDDTVVGMFSSQSHRQSCRA